MQAVARLAQSVESAGLDELWVWEDCFKQSGVASAAVALASTGRIRVGIGLMPTPLRNVALTAMEVATLARVFPGRLMPGVGHGVQEWMGPDSLPLWISDPQWRGFGGHTGDAARAAGIHAHVWEDLGTLDRILAGTLA